MARVLVGIMLLTSLRTPPFPSRLAPCAAEPNIRDRSGILFFIVQRDACMTDVMFLMGSWNAPSEHFLYRQLQMLRDVNALESIVAARLDTNTTWRNIPVFGLDLGPKFAGDAVPHLPTQTKLLREALARSKATKVLCQYGTIGVLFYSVLNEVDKELYIHVHGKDTEEHMHHEGYRQTFETLARRANIICSPFVYERLASWDISSERLLVKNYGVEIPEAVLAPQLNTPFTILHLGRLIDCKSPDRTIRAFELATERGLDGRLVIIGDGPLRTTCELLRSQSQWCDRIEILGFVPRHIVEETLRNADVFTQHAIRGETTGQVEAFGISIVEAMAYGLPVVTCAVGGIKYTVEDGETGVLFTPGDIEAQAAAFLRLYRDSELCHRLGQQGKKRAETLYSYEAERQSLISALRLPVQNLERARSLDNNESSKPNDR